ncbi:ATP-dependent DNA helicase 2 subunit 1 [Cloeon dipterum]|uniref:ATP-dependent DNA helicase 2 subunit 1 n=1 Tax=Cloeon dipterum TaxID=197152 RepID=UPI00321FDBD7
MDFEGSDDETNVRADFVAARNAAVFCIDASEGTLKEIEEDGKCSLQLCLDGVKRRILHNIFISDKEFVGIVLMGAMIKNQSNKNASNLTSNNSCVFFELSRPGAEICKELEYLCAKPGKQFKDDFLDEYTVLPVGVLSDSLWTCSSMMSLSNTKFGVKEVFIMTNNSMERIDPIVRRQTLKRVEALSEVGICIRLFSSGPNFNLQPFYKELMMIAHPEGTALDGSHWAISDLLESPDAILTKAFNNRQSARLDFVVTPGTAMAIKIYSLFRRMDHISSRQDVKLHRETNEQVAVHTVRYDTTSGEMVHPDSVVYGIKVEEGAAYFKKEERAKMKELYPVGIYLLGFKPISEVFWGDHIKPGILIVPDDEERSGSSSLFYSLLQVCVEKGVTPLVRVCTRKGSGARLAHLLPQLENASDGPFAAANCFYVVYMPFCGECRESEAAVKSPRVDVEPLQELAKTIIQKTSFKYLPSKFPNPKTRMHFNAIEALALDYSEVETVVDATEPDVAGIDLRVGEIACEFMAMSDKIASVCMDDE